MSFTKNYSGVMKKLLIVTNVDWFFISHRLCIAKEAIKKGWEVIVACEDTGRSDEIKVDGIKFVDFKFSRSGTNPLNEIKTLLNFYKLYNNIKPDIVHHITLKPVTYGSIVAKILKIKGVVNAISGLGYNFTADRKGVVQEVMIKLMSFGFHRKNLTVIFQNDDDHKVFQNLNILSYLNKIVNIKGSGVDLEIFSVKPFPSSDKIKILLPSRMLWDKGINELKEASDILKEKYFSKIQFILAGMADDGNKAGVPTTYLQKWHDGEYIKWIGYQKDMVSVYQNSHIVVLPSYREGMPKTLIEACAIGRPIVTTNAVGCKECVDEGINGYKVPVYSTYELANAIEKLILNQEDIIKMGRRSRVKAEKEFDVKAVIDKHLMIYKELS